MESTPVTDQERIFSLRQRLFDRKDSAAMQRLLDAPLVTADQMAYGAGVWAGVVAEREVGPLLPSFTNWPQRNGG